MIKSTFRTSLSLLALCCLLMVQGCAPTPSGTASSAQPGGLDRTILPIQEPTPEVITEKDARHATAPPRWEVKAPDKAPNVVIVLIDDFGFGQSSTFGGPINMPTFTRMSQNGLMYNRFHDLPLFAHPCSFAHRKKPSRQQCRRDYGIGYRLSRQYRGTPKQCSPSC